MKKKRTRPPRRPEEDIPCANYIERLEALGPREGESFLVFRKRLAAIKEARRLWLSAATKFDGDLSKVCAALGILKTNAALMLQQDGLHPRYILEKQKQKQDQ